MNRYMIRKGAPRAWDDYVEPNRINPTVDDHQPVDTGLVTSAGQPIMRLPSPIGFGRDGEW